jgi:hypothetical protein
MRKKLAFAGAGVLVALILVLMLYFGRRQKSGIPLAKIASIQLGMSQKEVEVILGCPPGDYTNEYNTSYVPMQLNWSDGNFNHTRSWFSMYTEEVWEFDEPYYPTNRWNVTKYRGLRVTLKFGADGKVIHRRIDGMQSSPPKPGFDEEVAWFFDGGPRFTPHSA